MGHRVSLLALLVVLPIQFRVPLPTTPPAGPPTAHIWVDTDGGTCVDNVSPVVYDTATACGTIDAGADIADAGDIVRVKAGTYVETVTPSTSGTSGNTITLAAEGTVTTCGFSFATKNYIRVVGFTIDPTIGGGCSAGNPLIQGTGTNTGLEFWHLTLQNNLTGKAYNFDKGAGANQCDKCIFIGGSMTTIGGTSALVAMLIDGDDDYVGYIDFATICYVGVGPGGSRGRFVNLNFSGFIQCGISHPDFYYIHGTTLGWSNNLIEANYGIGTPSASDNKGFHAQNETATTWADNIWRTSVIYNLGSGFYSIYDTTGSVTNFRFYHNTHVNCVRALNDIASCGNISAQGGHTVSASIINNVYYQGWSDNVTSGISGWLESSSPTVTKDYNLIYDPDGSVTFDATWNGQTHEQSNIDPVFVNAASDWHLQSGSGARGVGGPLTTASGSGSTSTSLTVAANTGSLFVGDNSANLAAYGGALVPGDVLTVGSCTARVSSRSGDVLTLATACSWSNADPVYFGDSTTIDIGAYPYKAGGYTLSATKACSTSCTITPNDASLVRFVVCYDDGVPYTIDPAPPYTCALPTGTFSARVYPSSASATLFVTAN